jgi:hypothetical protein
VTPDTAMEEDKLNQPEQAPTSFATPPEMPMPTKLRINLIWQQFAITTDQITLHLLQLPGRLIQTWLFCW